jgi:hypothetical protein
VRGLATSPAPGPRSRRAAAAADAARAPRSAALAAALLLTSARASRRRASAAASFASTSRFVRGLATSPLARASSLARNCFCSSSMSRRTAAASRRSLSAAMDTGFAGDASFIARPGGAALSFRSSLTGTRTLFFGVAILDQTGVDDVLGQRAGRRGLDLLDLKPSMLGAFFFMLCNVLFVIHCALCRYAALAL